MQGRIEEFLESLVARNLSPITVRAYRADLAQFAAVCGTAGFTRQNIRKYLVHLNASGASRKTVARNLAVVKSVSAWLAAEGYAKEDIAASILAPRVPHKLPSWPPEEEMEKLLEGEIPTTFPERDRLILELLYGTGIRCAELSAINLDDFRDEDTLLIRGKGKKERLVVFGECTQDALQAYLPVRQKRLQKSGRQTNALLFAGNGWQIERLTTRNVQRIVKAVALAKGLPLRHPHAYRHACATAMLDHGASIVIVSKLLGHAKLSTTEQYTHISKARMLQAYQAAHPHARTA